MYIVKVDLDGNIKLFWWVIVSVFGQYIWLMEKLGGMFETGLLK